ncbi:MAG: beta-glucanase (GH16 family) [Saprospiraceae bacterium]|jgi:beta-glucanase (GH16 family)
MLKHKPMKIFTLTITLTFLSFTLNAQCWNLVWEDEFFGSTLDATKWSHQTGGGGWGNNELQNYTDRIDNTVVVGGVLQITAKEEFFGGNDYTSARIRTINQGDFTYGKMEASIKAPSGQGIWPAFWMMPTDNTYGIWPSSGEIDIMELLGHQTNITYGTAHYGNSFSDKSSSGGSFNTGTPFSDAFHTYSVEWGPTQIKWFIDGFNFHTMDDTDADFNTYLWPFNHDFHFILNVAVGGDWPGSPDATTVFPATMEVDWVRVYQKLEDIKISGNDLVEPSIAGSAYQVPTVTGMTYNWTAPSGVTITSGQGTPQITVNWGTIGGDVTVDITDGCSTESIVLSVTVSANLWDNYNFESGYSNWRTINSNGANAAFNLDVVNPYEATTSACVQVTSLPPNRWDTQLGRANIDWIPGENYTLSFWAKGTTTGHDLDIAFINQESFVYYAGTTFFITDQWAEYSFSYNAPVSATVLCNFDLGDEIGTFCFDEMLFARSVLLPLELAYFEAERTEKGFVQLSWQTLAEENLSHFVAQRSQDLRTWEAIEDLYASNAPDIYDLLDKSPFLGESYYRLKSVDFDGTTYLSSVVKIEQTANDLLISPNPMTDFFQIKGEGIEEVRIYNLTGELVRNVTLQMDSQSVEVDCSRLTTGVYYVEILQNGRRYWCEVVRL